MVSAKKGNQNMRTKLLFAILFLPVLTFAQTYTYSTLVSFPATSAKSAVHPSAPIIDALGNLYGVFSNGGTYGGGTVFKVTPKGVLSLLYSFGAAATDGNYPLGTLVRDSSGTLYGITVGGGRDGFGTIFKLTSAGKETTLYNILGGNYPLQSMSRDSAGNLYGVDSAWPGWVFELTRTGTYKIMYEFCSDNTCTDGYGPSGGPIVDREGNVYGVTSEGGEFFRGNVYKVTPAGVEAILYSFTGGTDGDYPTAKLTQDATGNIYGVTANGGTYGYGTVYQVTPTGVETVLHSFSGGSDGNAPQSPIILDASGNLYGIAAGGTKAYGIVYKLTPSGTKSVLYEAGPAGLGSGMVMDKSGNLYGTSWKGGRNHTGTVYKLTKH